MFAFVAVLAVFALNFSSALVEEHVQINFNGVDMIVGDDELVMAGFAGDMVPVKVTFTANDSVSDVKVKVEVYSGSEESTAYTDRFNIVSGSTYSKSLNLQLPSNLDDTTSSLQLKVSVYSPDSEWSNEYTVEMQRDSYQLNVLSVDYDLSVSAGSTVPVAVVIKNTGFEKSNDAFVVVSIPELGVSAKGYLGDLVAVENDSDSDNEDATQVVLNLKIPASAKDGVYDLVVKAYDADSSNTVKESIRVSASSDTQVVASTNSQQIKAGETKTFDFVLVNSADKVMVYNLKAVSGSDLAVSVPSVITVDADSSKVVTITVTASSDATKGVHPFTVEANGQSTVFNVDVVGKSASVSAIVLTAVLIVVFVALLVVLLFLLFKKDKPTEEVETSYY